MKVIKMNIQVLQVSSFYLVKFTIILVIWKKYFTKHRVINF
jgi:hypothetical protein